MSKKHSAERLYVPWIELAVSSALLYFFAGFQHVFELSETMRGLIAIVCLYFVGAALGLLARNVFRAERTEYRPLPRWAFAPFASLFGLLATCVLIQLVAYFRVDQLGYVLFIAFIAAVGCGDVARTYALRRQNA